MLSVLTRYLITYRQLYIPYIGSFEVVPQPARLDIADKLLYPPSYEIIHKEYGTVGEDQWAYLGEELDLDRQQVEQQLERFGQQLRGSLMHSAFSWKGLGTLEYKSNRVVFSQSPNPGNLLPVEAHKVLRENVQHTVLIGEQEVRSGEVADLIQASGKKRSTTMIVAWIVLALAILFIIYYFYKEGFRVESSGLKTKVVSAGLAEMDNRLAAMNN